MRLFSFAAFLLPSILLAQEPTLQETEQWVIEKIVSFTYTEASNQYELEFSELPGGMGTQMEVIYSTDVLGGPSECRSWVSIKDIARISFDEKSTTVWMNIVLKPKHELSTTMCDGLLKNNMYSFILRKTVLKSDMPGRLRKAFSRLAILNGLQPIPDKEAF
jgi:hypothetical protein